MLRVLLVNVDCKWNLAIRRLYSYYKQTAEVDMLDVGFNGYPHKKIKRINASSYDKVYVSNIFEVNMYNVIIDGCRDIDYGGVGSRNPMNKLPDDIEMTPPFYFDDEDTSYGFITRGCVRNCWFCKVNSTEGKLREYNNVKDIIKHKKVVFLDNNILAYDKHLEVLRYLVDNNVLYTFKQGLDFRLVNDDNLKLLSESRYIEDYVFAFDDISYMPLLDEKIVLIKKYLPKPYKVKFYIYYHPSMSLNSLLKRVEWCRRHECLPYIMRDKECWSCDQITKNFLIDYTAYCNQPKMFKRRSFLDFLSNYPISETRRVSTYNLFLSSGGIDV